MFKAFIITEANSYDAIANVWVVAATDEKEAINVINKRYGGKLDLKYLDTEELIGVTVNADITEPKSLND